MMARMNRSGDVKACCRETLGDIQSSGCCQRTDAICGCGQAWMREGLDYEWVPTGRAVVSAEPVGDGDISLTIVVSAEDAINIPLMLADVADMKGDDCPRRAVLRGAAHAIREGVASALVRLIKPALDAERERRLRKGTTT